MTRVDRLTFDRTLVMGVVNVTPDSFSDGGKWATQEAAVARARELVREGVDIVDVGGESTRPGASPVTAEEERTRVVDVVRGLRAAEDVVISVDTYKAEVADAAIAAGADLINDVSGGVLDPALLDVAAQRKVPVILGHMRGTPTDMQTHASYHDVVTDVRRELAARIAQARARGVVSIWIDPCLGFSKTREHNFELLARLGMLGELACPIVIGASRKSFLAMDGGALVDEREPATAAAHALAVWNGAHVVRVHDVRAHRDAVRLTDAIVHAR